MVDRIPSTKILGEKKFAAQTVLIEPFPTKENSKNHERGRLLMMTMTMTMQQRDETFWYGEGWRSLRRSFVSLCLRESVDLLDKLAIGDINDAEINRATQLYVERVLRSVEERLRSAPDNDRWRHGLRLLAMPDSLAAALRKQRARFADENVDVTPEALLGTILKAEFESCRRMLQTAHSPHRQKTWEQIDRISRSLTNAGDWVGAERSREHLEAILTTIRRDHGSSRNLPRRIETLEDYFFEFSPQYRPESITFQRDADPVDERSLGVADLDFLEEMTGMQPDPLGCFEDLPEAHAEAFAVAKGLQNDLLPDSGQAYLNAKAFYMAKRISKRRFYRLVREATNLLVDCLQQRMDP